MYRSNPPEEINGLRVIRMLDYSTLIEADFVSRKKTPFKFLASDVIQFYLSDGTKVSVRPSGTEPKIKYYVSVNAPLTSRDEFQTIDQLLDSRIKSIEHYLLNL